MRLFETGMMTLFVCIIILATSFSSMIISHESDFSFMKAFVFVLSLVIIITATIYKNIKED